MTEEPSAASSRSAGAMKLLVFAHTPPPHHGQSYMVQLMLEGFGGDQRNSWRRGASLPGSELGVECYHVNSRFSEKLQEIGDFKLTKLLLLLGYCLEAIWCRFRYNVTNFYYIPAPGKRLALYRDWLVLFICRPFFKRVVLHWHASGLAHWLRTAVEIRARCITYAVAKQADLSIVLSNYGRGDAEKLFPRRVAVVGNGIPDPCPEFATQVLPRRGARLEVRRRLLAGQPVTPELRAAAGPEPEVCKVLFVAHCTRSKGLFEAVQGAIRAQKDLAEQHSPVSLKLLVAGEFVGAAEQAEFERLCHQDGGNAIEYLGYIHGPSKHDHLKQADGFCFPSHLESFGLVLVEAMAYGLPIVATRSGAMPEVLPPAYDLLVEVGQPDQVARALVAMLSKENFSELRARFEENFTLERHLARLAAALRSVERDLPDEFELPAPAPARRHKHA